MIRTMPEDGSSIGGTDMVGESSRYQRLARGHLRPANELVRLTNGQFGPRPFLSSRSVTGEGSGSVFGRDSITVYTIYGIYN